MVAGFNHSGFVVADLSVMVAFYKDALGMEVVREIDSVAPPDGDHTGISGARRRLVFLGVSNGEHLLELVHYVEPVSQLGHLNRNQLGASHICLNVDDLKALHKVLVNRGTKFVTPPIFRDTSDGGRIGICYAQDPEGNWLEFVEKSKE